MDKALIKPQEDFWERPVPYRSRYEITLPDHNNKAYNELVKITEFACRNFMEINVKKTKTFLFNKKARSIKFLPRTKLREQMKLSVTLYSSSWSSVTTSPGPKTPTVSSRELTPSYG